MFLEFDFTTKLVFFCLLPPKKGKSSQAFPEGFSTESSPKKQAKTMTQRIPIDTTYNPQKTDGAAFVPWPFPCRPGLAVLRGLRSAGAVETTQRGAPRGGKRGAVAGGADRRAREGGAAAQQVAGGEEETTIRKCKRFNEFNGMILDLMGLNGFVV